MDIPDLLEVIAKHEDCRILPRDGMPVVRSEHVLPADLVLFYSVCGGVALYESQDYTVIISSPKELQRANEVLLEGWNDEEVHSSAADISWSWYVVARDTNGNCITIDLDPKRLGKCYDSAWDVHAIRGSSAVIALSFTDLLHRLVANRGQHWYWLQPSFDSLGDAYDNED